MGEKIKGGEKPVVDEEMEAAAQEKLDQLRDAPSGNPDEVDRFNAEQDLKEAQENVEGQVAENRSRFQELLDNAKNKIRGAAAVAAKGVALTMLLVAMDQAVNSAEAEARWRDRGSGSGGSGGGGSIGGVMDKAEQIGEKALRLWDLYQRGKDRYEEDKRRRAPNPDQPAPERHPGSGQQEDDTQAN